MQDLPVEKKASVMVIVIRTKIHVGGYHLVPSSMQPRNVTGTLPQ